MELNYASSKYEVFHSLIDELHEDLNFVAVLEREYVRLPLYVDTIRIGLMESRVVIYDEWNSLSQ